MPNALHTAADRLDLATGDTIRTCRECGVASVLNAENFFHRVNRATGETTWVDARCQTCRRRRDAETRRARRTRGGRKFGVEMEVVGINRHDLERALVRRGLRVHNAGYTHQVMSSWKIVTDASVTGGYELVSPPLSGREGLAQLRKACEALNEIGGRVNRSCGLHVHHDVSDLNCAEFGRLFRAWSNNQRNVDGLVAPSRRGSNWARPLTRSEVEHCESIPAVDRATANRHFGYVDRYRSLNVAAFPRYGTVEVRQHQGTINFDKIAAWVAFGQAFVALAKSSASVDSQLTTDALVEFLGGHGLDAAQVEFLKGRAAHFAGRPVAA